MKAVDSTKTNVAENTNVDKKPYERARLDEHEPLQEAAASTYYYYTYDV